jgi:hypothetical protein
MKCGLLIPLLLLSCFSFSQKSDFFLLKKQSGKTVKSFYSGSYISFITNNKDHYSGYIKKVSNDSVWVEYQEVVRGMTLIGSILLDTITYQAKRFAVKDIAFIKKDKQGFEEAPLSGLMKLVSGGYILLHTVNGLIQKDKISLSNIGIAAGFYLAGVLLNKLKKDYYYIGNRYRLQYISLSD